MYFVQSISADVWLYKTYRSLIVVILKFAERKDYTCVKVQHMICIFIAARLKIKPFAHKMADSTPMGVLARPGIYQLLQTN